MNFVGVLKPFLGRPDPRPAKQIESDLDEEFAFHIEQITRELLDAEPALSHDEATRRAHARFGDTEQLKQRCKRIAMEDRIMLQRINAVLMIIVVLAVIGVSVQVYVTQRHNTLALQDITAQLTMMQVASPQGTGSTERGTVYIEGQVTRPGAYALPDHGGSLTLRRLLATAGGIDLNRRVFVYRDVNGSQQEYFTATTEELQAGADVVLEANDLIAVHRRERLPSSQAQAVSDVTFPRAGMWRETDAGTGEFVEDGAHIQVLSGDDIQNLRSGAGGIVEFPEGKANVDVTLRPNGTTAQRMEYGGELWQQIRDGRWKLDDDGHLHLNLADPYGVRLFKHVDTMHASDQ